MYVHQLLKSTLYGLICSNFLALKITPALQSVPPRQVIFQVMLAKAANRHPFPNKDRA